MLVLSRYQISRCDRAYDRDNAAVKRCSAQSKEEEVLGSRCDMYRDTSMLYPGFQKGRVPSEKSTRAVSGASIGHNWRGELKKKGTISTVKTEEKCLEHGTIKEAQHNQRCVWTTKRAKQS